MTLPSNFVSLTLFAIIAATITFLMIKSILLSYSKTSEFRKEMMALLKIARIEESVDFLSRNNIYGKGSRHDERQRQANIIYNEDLIHYSVSLCDFFSKFDCRNFSKLRGPQKMNNVVENGSEDEVERGKNSFARAIMFPSKTKTVFALPNGAVINKNFSLSQDELDAVWNQKSSDKDDNDNESDIDSDNDNDNDSSLPFKESTCAQEPFIFINAFGTNGNKKNFKTQAQKTVCGCERHFKLFVFPMTPKTTATATATATTPPPQFKLKIDKPGLNVLRFPFPGVNPLIERISDSNSNRYLLNTKGEIIFSDPCSQFDDGYYLIDDILIKRSEVNALRTKRSHLFKRFMETKQTPRRVNCKNQQVHELL